MSEPTSVSVCHLMRDGSLLSAMLSEGDLWFSQKTLSHLLGVSTANINFHVADLRVTRKSDLERPFVVTQIEGERRINRVIKHYSFDAAYSIDVRGRRFERLKTLQNMADQFGVTDRNPRIEEFKERAFGKLLEGALDGIAKVMMQHYVAPYFMDFYLPDYSLAVEYDEKHHASWVQAEKDLKRQRQLSTQLGVQFIRVRAGSEVEGLNQVLKFIFAHHRNFS